jgi:CHAT domain-containing protein
MSRRLMSRGGLALAVGLVAGPAVASSPFARCSAEFEARPLDYASSNCFFLVAQKEKRYDEAARLLDSLRAAHPRNFWPTLSRGNLEWNRAPDRAFELYELAANGFAQEKHAEGEVMARHNLRLMLYRKGRLDEAGTEVQRALAAAEASGEPIVLARALALEAVHLTDTGRSVSQALASLRRAEAAAFPDGPYTLRRSILFALGNASFQLGRYEDALGYYQRVEALTAETGDLMTRASVRYNLVNTRMRQMEELPRAGAREEIVMQARVALDTAVEADNREIQVLLHRTLGELLEGPEGRPDESRSHYERCVELGRRIGQPRELAHCLWSLAGELAEKGEREQARRVMGEALALVSGTGHVWAIAHGSRKRMRVSWATLPAEQALPESLQSLAAIEAVRELQQEDAAASVFSAWVSDYQWLAGRLLESPDRSRETLEQAFAVVERMRARSLLDALRAAKVGPPETEAQVEERKAVLRQIVDAHLARLDPGTSADARRELDRRIEALEARDRRQHAAFAGLREIEQRLGPTEALLSYQIGLDADLLGEPAGGGWVTVSTRAGTTAHRVVDRARLRGAVPTFLGLFAARDGREARPAAALYRDLLESAVSSLPDGVDRLLIVPDDVLHTLPFAALRATPDSEPIAARFEVTMAPSATLWLRFRDGPRASPLRTALVLADPELPGSVAGRTGPSRERGGSGSAHESLGPLPHARREGGLVTRRLAGTLRVGAAASERQLKSSPLQDFAILHFATHAVVDDEHPDRSSLVLAAAEPDDGRLQSGEIAALPLSGRVVVLAACRSAGGSLLAGEGVMSLARAFFQAGAHGVVASLWPLRDDEAAQVLDLFYARLERGQSLGAALAGAQRAAIAARLPSAAWSGLVVVGDASLVPFPGGVRHSPLPRSVLLAAAAALAVAAIGLWTRRRRRAALS